MERVEPLDQEEEFARPIDPRRRRSTRRNFEREQAGALAADVDDNPVFLATNKYNLQVTMERWPKVGFHATREHGRQLAHAEN